MKDKLKLHEAIMSVILSTRNKDVFSEEEIKEASLLAKQSSKASDKICKQAIRNIQVRFNVTIRTGISVEDRREQGPWYLIRKAKIVSFYWSRYREYLLRFRNFPKVVVNTIDRSTDEIMDLIGDPSRNDRYKIRGLILGDVQSGKTATYTALCNKAADAGYRVIILLTGTIENLRRQTQSRIDEGFVGLKSSKMLAKAGQSHVKVGVANIDHKGNKIPAVFTSELNDFNANLLNSLGMRLSNYKEPSIFVIKKNKRTLENLYTWLKTYNADQSIGDRIDLPMLLIDDEADNASVNTRTKSDPTTINRGIRGLLTLFTKSNYIGVTATPYANIFINPEDEHNIHKLDLFPENFIYALNPPSNYIGSEDLFGDEMKYRNNIEFIDDIDEYTEEFLRFYQKKTIGFDMCKLPKSLKNSIYYFIIINGILNMKGYDKRHRTMLINISRLKNVHATIVILVDDLLREINSDINNFCMLGVDEALKNSKHISEIKFLWDRFSFEKLYKISWRIFQNNLLRKASVPIEIREINSNSHAKRLNYDDYTDVGARFIAIGGNSLSRGLTLEGLCVSYFYRNSKMYDTLLQMGRWFGYRDGYDKLFRIWMTEEIFNRYQCITEATSELRQEIYRMNTYGLSPKDFGLRVRQDISTLLITARNKMRHTQSFVRVFSVAGKLIETPRLSIDKTKLKYNYDLVADFYKLLHNDYEVTQTHKNAIYFTKIDRKHIINLLKDFDVEPHNLAFNTDAFIRYTQNYSSLQYWDVAFPFTRKGSIADKYFPVKRQVRNIIRKDKMLLINGTKVRVGSGGCTQTGLSRNEVERIDINFKRDTGKLNVPDSKYLIKDRKPLLLIHIIKPNEKSKLAHYDDVPLVALGVGFPETNDYKKALAQYRINLVGVNKGFFEAEDEGDNHYDSK